jgi:L-iditol 2-dehydrogenase
MRVARLYDINDIRIEESPVPTLGAGDVLVRMAVCGICTGEAMPWYIRGKAPLVPGHELAGTVVEAGGEREPFSPGDRIFVHHHAPCMACRLCRRGHYSMCPTWRESALHPGGLAEFVRVPAHNLQTDTHRLPDTLSMEDGSLIEPTACAVQALKRRAPVQSGDTVLVIGLGAMGQILARLARHFGAGRVIVADRVPYRLQAALDLGADVAVDVSREELNEAIAEATGGDGADLVVVGPGSIAAMEAGLAAAGAGGTVLLFTPAEPQQRLSVAPHDLYFRHITLATSYSSGPPDTRDALGLIAEGVITAKQLVTHRYPLEETAAAFNTVAAAADSIKTVVVLDSEAP